MGITIVVTGGTFDKEYDEINGQLYFKDTHLREILNLGRCTIPVTVDTLMMLDSLQMQDADRHKIATRCAQCMDNKIVITHGTDTMVETAAILAKKELPKTIILTGAMIPYKFGSSDGLFNMGCALAFAQTLPQGVYITMNGRYFTWDNVRKNRTTGFFEYLE
ncbi:MAG: asparaginase domain-containing protein [Chitinophagales bacterium]